LQAEQAALEDELAGVDEQIAALEGTYADDKARLDQEAAELQERQRQIDEGMAALAAAEQAFEAAQKAAEEAEAARLHELEAVRQAHRTAQHRYVACLSSFWAAGSPWANNARSGGAADGGSRARVEKTLQRKAAVMESSRASQPTEPAATQYAADVTRYVAWPLYPAAPHVLLRPLTLGWT